MAKEEGEGAMINLKNAKFMILFVISISKTFVVTNLLDLGGSNFSFGRKNDADD